MCPEQFICSFFVSCIVKFKYNTIDDYLVFLLPSSHSVALKQQTNFWLGVWGVIKFTIDIILGTPKQPKNWVKYFSPQIDENCKLLKKMIALVKNLGFIYIFDVLHVK